MSDALLLEMVSDVVCPWCWLGFRRLRATDLPGNVTVRFRPFELDPTVPQEGTDYRAYMSAKFGRNDPDNGLEQMRTALETHGAAEGIPFDFAGLTLRPNTLNAHRLIRWAQGQELGAAAMEALFAAYFRDHRDIGSPAVLSDIAGEIGLEADMVAELLARGADVEAVRAEEQLFISMGVGGVPIFIADRRNALQGAQEAATLARFVDDVMGRTGA
jgi:predicted DsbA family dithiol-disulfide isomerase